jgi:hypothetical protein
MLNVRISNVTMLFVHIEWDQQPGCIGYWIFRDGKRVSWTADPTQTTTRFLKPLMGSAVFGVQAIMPGIQESIVYPQLQPKKADPLMPLRGS